MIYTDQLGREVSISNPPLKIISTVPSQTELLFDLSLKSRIAGITKFCIRPQAGVNDIVKIGGTKQLDLELIKRINPDLIIANKEENDREQIEALAKDFPVWISDIFDLDDSLQMIKSIAEITQTESEAAAITQKISNNFQTIQSFGKPLKTLYFIWRKPYMVAGQDTFIDDMLTRCGFINVAPANRYPEMTVESITEIKPDMILLSSEPYPFKEKHINELKALLPQTAIYLVDGEMFSWYGSRLVYAPAYFNSLITSMSQSPSL